MMTNLDNLMNEFAALELQLADPDVLADQNRYRTVMQRYSELRPIVAAQQEYASLTRQQQEAQELLGDSEMAGIAREELQELEPRLEQVAQRLQHLLLPADPFDRKNVIIEIRAAAGGGEASLFAAEALEMYQRYSGNLNYGTEIIDSHATEVGGVSRVAFQVTGSGAYSHFKFESGVHRVQRVPETETQGRIHTSTITVAVMPEAEDIDVNLTPADYRVDVFRSSGPGGQSVNTTDSAVRVTYRPGTADEIIVTCQDGKSQLKNREQALVVLRARLLEREREKAAAEQREARLVQIGGGDRSEKIRTYNFPQSRVTDHRIGFNTRNLAQIMQGDLAELTAALTEAEQERRLTELSEAPAEERTGEQA